MKIATKYKLAIVDNDEVSVMETEETVFVNESITEEERHDLFDDDLDENEPIVYENNDDEDEFEMDIEEDTKYPTIIPIINSRILLLTLPEK